MTFKYWGIVGPAATTLILTVALTIFLLHYGAKEIGYTIKDFFDKKEILFIIIQLSIVGLICWKIKYVLNTMIHSNTIVLVIIYCIYAAIMLLLNFKKILNALREISACK